MKGISPQLQRFQLRPHAARLPNLLRHGQSEPVLPRGGHEGVRRPFQETLSPRKASTIEWCILETVQDEERACLAKAKCISVAMGERKNRLLVTYAACRGTAVCSGVLAQLRCPGRSAAMTAACVAAAARRL